MKGSHSGCAITACLALFIGMAYVSCGGRGHFGKLSSSTVTAFRVIEDTQQPETHARRPASETKLVWISLDGLKEETLKAFLSRERQSPNKGSGLHPFGIKYLMETQGSRAHVQISDPTITASSHASTMSCAPAGVHGIVSNLQWNGNLEESGFETPYTTETFVHALRQKGLRVGVSGYPGFDSKTENRSADLSISYFRSEGATAQFIDLAEFNDGRRFTIGIPAPVEKSKEQLELPLHYTQAEDRLVVLSNDGTPMGKVTSERWTKIIFESNGKTWASNLKLFHRTESPRGPATLYVSPALGNAVAPAALQAKLDQSNLIFPFGKDFALADKFGEQAFIESLEQRLNYFTSTSHALLDEPEMAVLFLYFEDLDVLGHRYEGDISRLRQVDSHLRKFDKALGSILQRVNQKSNIVITGDHGMSAIQYELNALELLPAHLKSGLQIRAAGGSLFVYGPDANSLRQNPPITQEFTQLVQWLKSATVPGTAGQNIFTKVVVKGTQESRQAQWREGVPLPWIHATARPEIGLVASVEPRLLISLRRGFRAPRELLAPITKGSSDPLPQPRSLGQHGHASEDPEMMTRIFAWGPGLANAFQGLRRSREAQKNTQDLSTIMNTELVPLVAGTLDLPRPESCR